MCGIFGIVDGGNVERSDGRTDLERGLAALKHRGLDGSGTFVGGDAYLGHCLHAIVSHVQQPIVRDDIVVGANCEIYNWERLAKRHGIQAENDAELLAGLCVEAFSSVKAEQVRASVIDTLLSKLDGVFSFFVYHRKFQYVLLARDRLGVKPLWFSAGKEGLRFSSERTPLIGHGELPEELNPRKALVFSQQTGKTAFYSLPFFSLPIGSHHSTDILRIAGLLDDAVKKRISGRKMGVLFSGGLDSSLIAHLLTAHGADITGYLTATKGKEAVVRQAKEAAAKIGIPLKVIMVSEAQLARAIPGIMRLISSQDPVKVEVASTLHFALQAAKRDNVKVMYSGLGADDLFAGYGRMRVYPAVNEDSLSNLRRIYERDLYRDDVISMSHHIELRLPYLDHALVSHMFSIPSKEKLGVAPKQLLRDAAVALDLPEGLSAAKRSAAQYSSGMSKLIETRSKKAGFKSKSSYLASLADIPQLPLGVLFSSGKDSVYALHIQKRLNYDVRCLITVKSENKDSFMFHTPAVDLAGMQADAMGIPLMTHATKGEKEQELSDLRAALLEAKRRHGIQGVVTGALFSNYQRTRIERICDELNLKVFSPLWHMDQEQEMRALLREGYRFVMTKVAAEGLDASWLGVPLTNDHLGRLVGLRDKLGINVAGEGGEFETFVLDAPLFGYALRIVSSSVKKDGEAAELLISSVEREPKD
ncbi:MAG: diphthine--ammonia ligase [archaeon]